MQEQQQSETEFQDDFEYTMHLLSKQAELREVFEQKFVQAIKDNEALKKDHQSQIDELKKDHGDHLEAVER